MPRYIVHHDGWFFEWSTAVDAPFGYGAKRAEFEREYAQKYGAQGKADLPALIERALANGTSKDDWALSAEDLVGTANSAGYDETHLPLDEIVRIYCAERRDPRKGEGSPSKAA